MPPRTLAELVLARQGTDSEVPLLTFVEIAADGSLSTEQRSFAQLWQGGQALAAWMTGRGVTRGDRLAIMMNNHPEFVDAMVAAAMIGAVWVPIDPRTRGEKLAYMLDFAGCSGIVAADYCAEALAAVVSDCPCLRWSLLVGEAPDCAKALPDCAMVGTLAAPVSPVKPVELAPTDPMFMMFTSGMVSYAPPVCPVSPFPSATAVKKTMASRQS